LSGLAEKELASKRSLDEARLELEAAKAEVTALRTALEPVGEDAPGGLYDIRAPLAGTVVRREGTIGQKVEAEHFLYEIVDPSWVWAELDVPEADLARVRAGLEVVVSSDSLPGHEFEGRIDHIAPEIDAHTRTAKARVRLANPAGLLRANQFVRGRIVVERLGARVRVPREAVQRANDVLLVFVALEPARYEARRVRAVGIVGDEVELLRGVQPGELVVTRGSFLLKTETLKGEIGAGCCAVE
jgi:cobalt-zinc-cadmium efflux system membrane fusion protein